MERKNKHFNNRFTSLLRYFLCALLIAMLVIPFATLTSNDIDSYVVTSESLSYSGLTSTTSINSKTVDDIDVSLYQSLTNNGDGTYSIELTPKASFSVKDLSAKSTDAKYGYFMAPKNGTYIFEVWGGNGGEGQDTSYSNGGKGGQCGYLNASLEMQKGDYIFYTIGGNGQQTPSKSYGGGANGDGGDHGESGRYIVGGGGGYTAVYYFAKGANANSFAYKYLDGTSLKVSNLDEADRLTKYVLVAGGGGGGGAGNAFSVTNKAIATPDGGSAGSLTSASGTITNAEVPGTYYAGSNGKSSGTSQEYVGVGGSNTPGEEKSTLLDFYDGKVANDWAGSFNAEYPGGSGGAGNLRGGAGGAGFCGGSGGIMTGLVVGTNVGGGGGGSSFIASTMSSLTAEQQKYITNDNESSTGGAVYITFVPSQTELDVVQNLTLSGTISDYFTIESVEVSDTAVVSTSGKNFSISKVNALEGATPETTITIKVKPVTGFMGGNDVPIFTTGQKIAFQKSTDSSTSYEIGVSDSCAYLNLPYAYTDPTTYQKNTSAKVSDLFDNAGYSNTDFITVSSYSIKDSSGTSYTNLDATLSPEATTIYTVSYTVTPNKGSKAVVGDRLSSKIYTANAKILVAAKNVLNGNTMEVTKTLSYASNVYTLNVNVKTNGTYEISPSKPSSSTNTYSSPGTGSYTVSTSGYYYIQVWGGNGGQGGYGKHANGSVTELGALGGSGGYVGAYIHLAKNDVITYSIGRNGQVGDTASNWTQVGRQGEGGKLTKVSLNSSPIIIAGGGGGGEGDGAIGPIDKGGSVDNSSFGTGSNGSPETTKSDKTEGGSAGTNYIDSTKATSQTQSGYSSSDYSNNGGGAVYISCISTDGIKNTTLSDYSVEASFADNFELIATTPVSASGVSSKTISGALVSSIVPSENVTSNVQYVNFTVIYKLKAKDSCLGGNSILLLKAVKISQVDKNSSTIDDVIYAEAKETTDYANVAISQTYVNNHFTVTANTVDYLVGSTGIEKSQLYSASTTFTPSASDYVESYLEEVPLIEAISTPTTSKSFDIHYGLKPKTTAVNGIVGPAAVNTYVNSNYTAKINTYQEVEFNLTNVTATAPTKTFDSVEKYIATNSNNYTATLSAVGDNKIVCVGSVQIDGEEIKNYTFDSSTGTITIPKDEITGKVTISAGSKDKDIVYKLYFAYAKDREGSSYGTKTPLDFKAEADISTSLSNLVTLSPAPTSYTGYKYVIEYPNGDICDYPNVSSTFTKMPAENTWIFAYYVPIEYTLTINYVNESGTSLADSIVLNNKDTATTCYYDMAFSYDSPAVANYAPDHVEVNKTTVTTYGSAATVSGKMPNSDLTINVVYKSLGSNEVSVTISYADGLKATVQKTLTKSDGKITITYSSETGYDVVKSEEFSSGVAFATTSQFITITYVPKQYEVIFSSGSGASTCANRAVFYGKEYGYTLVNGATKYEDSSFEPLPVPVKNGWVFEGWFIDNTKITESTVFNGSANVTLTANWLPYELTNEYVTIENIADKTYTGKAIEPTLSVKWNLSKVTWLTAEEATIKSTYYSIKYENNVNVDDDSVAKVIFNGYRYSGTITKDFNITQANNAITSLKLEGWTYGNPNSPSSDATFGKDTVTYSYSDSETGTFVATKPSDVGTYYVKATIAETSNYKGATKTALFTITSKTIDDLVVELDPKDGYPYDGKEHEPNIIVKDGDTPLSSPDDYEIEYINKKNAPKGKFKIKFKGNYEDTPDKEVEYDIDPIDTSTIDLTITLYDDKSNVVASNTYTYDGNAKTPTVTITHNEFDSLVTLVEGTDYEVTYSNNINAGTATANISYIGNYSGTDSKDFTINSKEIEDLVVELDPKDGYPYDGKEHEPNIIVKDGDTPLSSPDDYEIEYINKKDAPKGKFKIKFKGNYKDTPEEEVEYDINPLDLTNGKTSISLSQYTYTYTKSACTPTVTIYHDTFGKLTEGTDFDVEYKDNVNVGTAKANIKYKGNYTGTASETFTINALDPSDPSGPETTISLSPDSFTYDGNAKEPTVTITITGIGTLTKGTDFDVDYVDNTNAGTAKANITYKNNYSGTASKDFTINSKNITPTITITPEELTYDGDELEPKVEVKDENGNPLKENEDFIVTYDDNTSTPKGKIKIEFINNYKNTSTENKEFTINPKTPLESETTIELSQYTYTYSGVKCEPTVTITITGIGTLTKGTDFKVEYINNIDVGTATANITYINNYSGTASETFTINELDPSDPSSPTTTIELSQYTYTYDGTAKTPTVTITITGIGTLGEDDFDVDYVDNTNAGTAAANITYKGNYSGTATKNFIINSKVITPTITITPEELTYNGDELKPEVEVKDGDKTLKENEDYIITYDDNTSIPKGKIKIEFINNYKNTPDENKEFKINTKTPLDSETTITLSPTSYTYDGEEHEPTVSITITGIGALTENVDFYVTYINNINAGTATAKIKYIGNYSGTASKDFTINSKVITPTITITPEELTYDGDELEPKVEVKDENGNPLKENEDFIVTYDDNTSTPKGKIKIEFINNYKNTPTENKEFTINPKTPLDSETTIELSQYTYTFNGSACTPTVTITITSIGTLTEGTDFEVEYKDNTNVGAAKANITYIGNYTGTASENFTINELDPSDPAGPTTTIELSQYTYTYSGSACEPTVTITITGIGTLVEGTDFDVEYVDNTNAGTAAANITYKGNYSGTASESFTINSKVITPTITITPEELTYDGDELEPEVEVKDENGNPLTENEDYIVTYDDNTSIPKGKIKIEFINNYKNTPTENKEFTINPKTPSESETVVTFAPASCTYTGSAWEPVVYISIENIGDLTEGTDFDVTYSNNINAGFATANITYKGNYFGTATATFTIDKVHITAVVASIDGKQYDKTTNGSGKLIAVGAVNNETPVVEGTFTWASSNAGTDTITISNIHLTDAVVNNNYILDTTLIEDYKINDTKQQIQKKTYSPSDFEWSFVDDEFTYDGTEKSVSITSIPEAYTAQYKNAAKTTAGTYVASVKLVPNDPSNYEPLTIDPLVWTINRATYDMSNAKWDYNDAFIYDGTEKSVHVINLPEGVSVGVYYSATQTAVGTYSAIALLSYDTTNYNAPVISELTWAINKKPTTKDLSDKDGIVTVETEDGIPYDLEIYVELKASAEGKETANGTQLSLQNELGFGEAFGDVYEIKIMRDGQEIQPSDIAPGTILKVKMKVPENLVGKTFRIIHIHNNDDISYITKGNNPGIGTYIIDEEGYIITMINKFSEFAFVYNVECISHWFLLALLLLFIAFVIVYITVLEKKVKKNNILIPIIGASVFALGTLIAALLGTCYYCIIMTIVNGFALVIAMLLFAYRIFKNKPTDQQVVKVIETIKEVPTTVVVEKEVAPIVAEAKEETPIEEPIQEETIEEPATEVVEEVEPVVEEIVEEPAQEEIPAEETPIEEGISLKESIALASTINQPEENALSMSKMVVYDYLNNNYKDIVELNHRVNYTKTGLPLADTHYDLQNEKKACFTYVYELENGNVFFLIRANNQIANEIKEKHNSLVSSAFPKSAAKDWYTMVLDDSFKSNDDVFEVLDMLLGKKKEDNDESLSLKESIALAQNEASIEKAELNMSKKAVCDYLSENYKDQVEINTRVNYTKTGLPLADTHYDIRDGKVCFTYVYELEDGTVFFLIRTNDQTAKAIKEKHAGLKSSAFPKSAANDWYTMILDDSFKSNDDVFEVIDMVLGKQINDNEEGLSLKESIELAKNDVTTEKEELHMSKKAICDYLSENYKDKVEINTRINYTKTGLPLADTHYDLQGEKKVCFTYVYELDNGNVFFLIRANNDTAKLIKSKHAGLKSSAFPKSAAKDWYTMILDDSFNSNDDVYEVLDLILNKNDDISEEGLSLKESIELAKNETPVEKEELHMSKKAVCDYLCANYDGKVEINTRINYTKTGLPLADTHYDLQSEKKVCFTYVYELENGNVFFLIRANNDTAKVIKAKHNGFKPSAFPKSPAKDWYTMILDDSFNSNEDVFDVLDLVLNNDSPIIPTDPSNNDKTNENDNLSLKESIELAKNESATEKEELNMSKQAVCDYLSEKYKEQVEINTRVNYTKTGLPLADTHYDIRDGKVCFTYVYELEDGTVFFLIRTNDQTAKAIKEKHAGLKSSAFPKSAAHDWYTMILDDSFKSNDDVFEVLDMILEKKEADNLEGVSLKESIALAQNEVTSNKETLNISKNAICEYLNKYHKEEVEINTRENYTKTGLPLADTHYDLKNSNRICFTYVYELNDGTVFLLIRTNEETSSKIKAKHKGLISSAFPKSSKKEWYTMILDDSFKSNKDVFDVLDMVLASNKVEKTLIEQLIEDAIVEEPIKEESVIVEEKVIEKPIVETKAIEKEEQYITPSIEEIIEEKIEEENSLNTSNEEPIAPIHEIIKEEVSVTQAQEIFADEEIKDIVEKDSANEERYSIPGKEDCVNIDILSKSFENGDTVDIQALKNKNLVSKNATKIKILARGKLNKSLIVYADNYSTDAAKMIVACGGKLIELKKK